jgi:hypothetical protein
MVGLLAWLATTTVSYLDVPPEVERVLVYEWRERAMPEPVDVVVTRDATRAAIRARPGISAIVTLVRRDGAYLLDGPFAWPATDRARSVDGRWRRSIPVALPPLVPDRGDVEWLSPSAGVYAWPRCIRAGPRAAICWGVALRGAGTGPDAGIAFIQADGRLWWSLVIGHENSPLRSAAWGRLVVIRDDYSGAARARAAIQYPVGSARRLRNLRLETAAVPDATAIAVSPRAVWICGEQVPARAWVEVRGVRAGPVYLQLRELADAPVSLPVHVVLDEARAVDGLVFNARDGPAADTLLTVFRLLPAPEPSIDGGARDKPSRVFVAELTTKGNGEFRVDGLGAADYEIVAWHSQLGRATARIGDAQHLEIHLRAPGLVRGRVLSGGRPLPGIDVLSAPDPLAVGDAEDLLNVKGGDTRTGADGRFVVSVAAAGGGELRIGGSGYPVRRIPLSARPASELDIGDIELGAPIAIVAVLDDDPACGVRAVGPVGRTGVQMVNGTRSGPGLFRFALPEPGVWEFSLLCGREERPLSPGVREIGPEMSGKEVRFSVR